MIDWRRVGLNREASRVVGFLAAVAVVSAVGLLLVSAPGPAQTAPTSAPAVATPALGLTPADALPAYDELAGGVPGAAGPGWTDVVGLVLKLGLVLALLLLALRGLQRLSGRPIGGPGRPRSLELLETLHVNQTVSLFLVAVGQRVILIGGTPQQVELLAEIDDPAVLDRLRPSRARPTDFNALLDEARAAPSPVSPYRPGS